MHEKILWYGPSDDFLNTDCGRDDFLSPRDYFQQTSRIVLFHGNLPSQELLVETSILEEGFELMSLPTRSLLSA